MRHGCLLFNDTATTEIYALSLHDALPISAGGPAGRRRPRSEAAPLARAHGRRVAPVAVARLPEGVRDPRDREAGHDRSEEHTSELQSRQYLVCRLLLEKKTTTENAMPHPS